VSQQQYFDPVQIKQIQRVGMLAACWLPFVGLELFVTPRFAPILRKLAEHEALPPLTMWLWGLSELWSQLYGLPAVGFLAILVILDWWLSQLALANRTTLIVCKLWAIVVPLAGLIGMFLWFTRIAYMPATPGRAV
jgi:type II secretory pathway component PulF